MILGLAAETKARAGLMAKKKEAKIKQLANQLLGIQLSKIDSKLKYLQEYENAIWQEKRQAQIFQQQLLADRIELFSLRHSLQGTAVKQEFSNSLVMPTDLPLEYLSEPERV